MRGKISEWTRNREDSPKGNGEAAGAAAEFRCSGRKLRQKLRLPATIVIIPSEVEVSQEHRCWNVSQHYCCCLSTIRAEIGNPFRSSQQQSI